MRLLVIGGTRFVGPTIVRVALEAGHDVLVFHRGIEESEDSPDVEHIHGDKRYITRHADRLLEFRPDAVIETSHFKPGPVSGVVELLAGRCERYVMLSSVDMYRGYGVLWWTENGPVQRMPVDEDAELRTVPMYDPLDDPVGESDDQDNPFAEAAALRQELVPATVVRLAAVFGIGDPQGRVKEQLDAMREGGDVVTKTVKGAKRRRSYGFVDNVADALLLCAADRRDGNHVYNVAYPEPVSGEQWFRLVADAMNWKGTLEIIDEPPDPKFNHDQDLFADTSKIRRELGYEERVGIAEAIRRTVEWELSRAAERTD